MKKTLLGQLTIGKQTVDSLKVLLYQHKSQLRNFLVYFPWQRYLNSPNLKFLVCKMGIIFPSKVCWENKNEIMFMKSLELSPSCCSPCSVSRFPYFTKISDISSFTLYCCINILTK